MKTVRIFTIGVYESTESAFFDCLSDAGVDLLVDIRQRRGVRGAEYAFANFQRLVAGLNERGIAYLHELALAPTTAIRHAQYEVDHAEGTGIRHRDHLSQAFADAYRAEILAKVDLSAMVEAWSETGTSIALMCVERSAAACHRGIVANELARILKVDPVHLLP